MDSGEDSEDSGFSSSIKKRGHRIQEDSGGFRGFRGFRRIQRLRRIRKDGFRRGINMN